MKVVRRNIPNILTLTNLFFGLCGIVFAFEGNLLISGYCIIISCIADFLDGFLARNLKISSDFGRQLDSLADMVSFGVAPGIILFQLIYYSITSMYFQSNIKDPHLFWAFSGFFITISSAIRLAKYNIDEKQENFFIGMPTPASALLIASIPLTSKYSGILHPSFFLFYNSTSFLMMLSLALPIFLVSKIPLFSLKLGSEQSSSLLYNRIRVVFITFSVLIFFVFLFSAIPFILILYLFLSIIHNFLK